MKILLAPAETKQKGGENLPYCPENFAFKEIFEIRNGIVQKYQEHIQNSRIEELSLWFGLKNFQECEKYSYNILKKPTMKAILRYTGVAFDAIDYPQMDPIMQNYCDTHIIIFSNLFGPLQASDKNYQY